MQRAARIGIAAIVPALLTGQIMVSDPVLVAEAPADVRRWGFYQFPVLDRLLDGRIALTFHVNPDSARSYGQSAQAPNRGVSADGGRTWTLTSSEQPTAGTLLANGDRLRIVTPRALPVGELKLPPSVGAVEGSYGKLPYTYYRVTELPANLQGIPLARLKKGASGWIEERARMDDPEALRYSVEGVFPIVWWGDMKVMHDGSVLAVVYPGRLAGQLLRACHVFCYRSRDNGASWQVQGRILYEGDRDGFTEPAFEVLADGSLLCLMRTTDGKGVGPMFSTRSKDGGKTWSRPQPVAPTGVLPRLLRLRSGVLVLSSGRPGVDLRFSLDGKGESWTAARSLVPLTSDNVQADSCGYTSLLALDEHSFLIAYSWFNRPGADGKPHKAILVRRVTI